MGPIGAQEMFLIFIAALVLFGPKKLPELGRTVGKALSQFRRVSADMKSSFEREMQNLERETEAEKLREIGTSTIKEIQSKAAEIVEYPYYDSGTFEPEPYTDYTAAINPPVSASEVPGAEESNEAEEFVSPATAPETAPDNTTNSTEAKADKIPPSVEGTVAREFPQHIN